MLGLYGLRSAIVALCIDIDLLSFHIEKPVMCLTTDARLTADPGVASSIPAETHTFVEIDHEIISTVIHSRRVVVSHKKKYVQLLVNRLFKLAQEKSVVR